MEFADFLIESNKYESTGVLAYSIGTSALPYKLVLNIDQGIVDYYRKMVPKYHFIRPQMYPAHISIVRREIPPNLDKWGIHEGEIVSFTYDNEIHTDGTYYWINAHSNKFFELRKELGLPNNRSSWSAFHFSIGNCKNI